MAKILQLSPHVANLIAAGEVVERPASVAKELLENAIDAGATSVTLEIRDGGMTFLRVTDNGCGMQPEDARTAFLRHATSKLRNAEDLAAIATMGFRGEALAAIASVSRIDLLTRCAGTLYGTSLSLEAGNITDESEAGCPEGTTIIVRDLFFNTPARMKFMKSDIVEGSRVSAAVQQQALAHPEVSFSFIKDGKQVLHTPGDGKLSSTLYSIYGKDSAHMAPVDSSWEQYSLTGFVTRPTDARPSRSMQTFFVNGRPVKSRLMMAALEEAYRNRIMTGKFPGCVLHLSLPVNAVDVNVHPAKTEVKFLNEKAVFDCIHYGVLGALNNLTDRPDVKWTPAKAEAPAPYKAPVKAEAPASYKAPAKHESFFRTMTAQEYKAFAGAMKNAPAPDPVAAASVAAVIEHRDPVVRQSSIPAPLPVKEEQQVLPQIQDIPWRLVGELYNSYILVEQGDEAFLIDKHAAHERILFDKLKENQEAVSSQQLLTPVPCRLDPANQGVLLSNMELLEKLGFQIEEFGDNTLLLRQVPMDLSPDDAAGVLEELSEELLSGRREDGSSLRDELLHTVACKAAIKAGWISSKEELTALAAQVMAREDLKYCPHGRPICVSLSKKQLEKQFKRA